MPKNGKSKPGAIGGKKRKRRTASRPIVDSIEGQSVVEKRARQMSQAPGSVQGSASLSTLPLPASSPPDCGGVPSSSPLGGGGEVAGCI